MMAVNPGFIRHWRAWRRATAPVANFENGRDSAPSYGLECELDHLRSYVAWLGGALIDGEEFDYARLASGQLDKLRILSEALDALAIQHVLREELTRYMELTEELLLSIVRQDTSAHNV